MINGSGVLLPLGMLPVPTLEHLHPAAPKMRPDQPTPANKSQRKIPNPNSTNTELSAAELKQVEELQRIDRKVQAHEMAHLAAGAGLVRGGPTYGYETGPDGRRYAVSGEVSIDGSPADTPERTVTKAARIKTAALAPADPSAQDRRVAASAEQMAMDARMQIAQQQRMAAASDRQGDSSDGPSAYGQGGIIMQGIQFNVCTR